MLADRRRVRWEETSLTLTVYLIAFSCVFYIGIPVGPTIVMRSLDVAVFAAALILLPKWWRTRKRHYADFEAWMFAFFGTVLLSILISCIRTNTFRMDVWLKAIRFCYLLLVVEIALTWRKRDGDLFVRLLIYFGSVEAVFTIVMYIFQIERFCANQTFWKNGMLLQRASGFVSDAASFAFLSVVLFFVSLDRIIKGRTNERISAIICLVSNFIGVYVSRTRTAMISVAAISIILLTSRFIQRKGTINVLSIWRAFIKVLQFSFLIVGFVIVLTNLFFSTTVKELILTWLPGLLEEGFWGQINEMLSQRLYIWVQYLYILVAQPVITLLFGAGYFIFETFYNVVSIAGNGFLSHRPTHNMFLNTFVGMGMLGWVCLGGVLVSAVKRTLQKGGFSELGRVLLLGQLIFMLIDDSLTMVNSAAIVFIVVALAGQESDTEKLRLR